ncbi:hypothetical protein B0H19DRAFT_1100917 [Mycena capillaripes]|nr:hypothetical protein B0H19DRAFT_1100917 [Mycena capillaripes]
MHPSGALTHLGVWTCYGHLRLSAKAPAYSMEARHVDMLLFAISRLSSSQSKPNAGQ